MTQAQKDKIIKELQEKLAEAEKIKVDPRWKPECGEGYYSITTEGRIWGTHWTNDSGDNWCYLTGNCFKTEEEAKEHKKKIEYTARYKNYIEEHSELIDWNDNDQVKYYAQFCYNDYNKIEVDCLYYHRNQGIIYASSEEIIWDAIKEIGEDNFKKYVLEAE